MLSSKQKGDIAENIVIEMITFSTDGGATCYRPVTDDDGVDLIVNPKGKLSPIFIQVKSRFRLNKNNRYIQNVGINTFSEDRRFYLIFLLINDLTLEIDCLWVIPSIDFKKKAYFKKEGNTYKAFYRFSANPSSNRDQWSEYKVNKEEIGGEILSIIKENN